MPRGRPPSRRRPKKTQYVGDTTTSMSTRYKKSAAKASYVPTVFPLKWRFKTRYVDTQKILNATPGSMAGLAFSANSLYDPDYTGTGHQPMGYDQLMVFYDHYTVIGSKIKMTIQNESDQHPVIVALQVCDDAANAVSQIGTLIENGAVKWKRLARQGSDGSFANNEGSRCILEQNVSIKKFMGRPNILSEDDLRGTLTTSPQEQVFFKLFLQSIDGSADAVQVSVTTEIEYVAILTEPKTVIGS